MNKMALVSVFLLLTIPALFSQEAHKKQDTGFAFICFQNTDKTWGYNILRSGKLFIHQPTIPAVAGMKRFRDKLSASKIAWLVIKKLKEKPNEFPTITIEELQKLKIID